MDRLEFAHGGHTSKFEGVVLVSFSFDVAPLPGVFVSGTDERFLPKAYGEVVDPARRTASFHDNEVAFSLLEKSCKVVSFGSSVDELMFARSGIINATHGIELAEVKSENDHQFCSLGLGLEFCDVSASQAQSKITGQSRQILFKWLPPQTQDLHGFFCCS